MKNKKMLMGILALTLVFGFAVMGCGAFTNVAKVSNYLSLAQQVGRSEEGPVPLAVKINLDSDWESLVSTINGSGVNVNLDLSGCALADGVFNPGKHPSAHIVSLVLPDAVKSIAGDFDIYPNLAAITFPAAVDVGDVNHFDGCPLLTFKLKGRGDLSVLEKGKILVRGSELLSYPSAAGSITLNDITSIGRSAFNGAAVQSINLPSVTAVGIRAFRGCKELQTVSLPAAATIGDEAFYGNIGLQTLDIPAVVTIGNGIASNTENADLTITVGRKLETIGTGMFTEVSGRKNVIVKAPQSEVETITAMRNAFRGRGWSEGAFTLGETQRATGRWGETIWVNTANGNINFTVEGY